MNNTNSDRAGQLHKRSESRQWSTASNASDADESRKHIKTDDNAISFGSVWDGQGGTRQTQLDIDVASLVSTLDGQRVDAREERRRRRKQVSAPAESTFWKGEEN